MTIQETLTSLNIVLPPASEPKGSYSNCVQTGSLVYVSGKAPIMPGQTPPKGKLGREFTAEEGYAFARTAGIDILSSLQQFLGSLDRVTRVVKLQGFINSVETFEAHPKVLDGCSDLMVDVFGDAVGKHARSVFGAMSVRSGLPIIIDSIFEVDGV